MGRLESLSDFDLLGVSGVHLPNTSPRDRGVLLARWEDFASFPDLGCISWELRLSVLGLPVRAVLAEGGSSGLERPVAGNLGVLGVAGRGLRQPRPAALRSRCCSARGLAHVASASSGRILCGNCLLVGSSAENAPCPCSTRRDGRNGSACFAFKGESGGNGRGYRSPFLLRLPHNFSRSSGIVDPFSRSRHPCICSCLDGK